MWDGKGWPGRARRRGDPARGAARAARRVRRGRAPRRRRRRGAGARAGAARRPVRPRALRPRRRRGARALAGLDTVGTWDAVIDAEPALAVMLARRAVRRRAARDRELRRPEVAVHARPRARGRRARRARGRRARAARARDDDAARRASCTTSAGSASRTRSGTSAGRSAPGEWERVRLHPYLTERMLQQSEALAPLGAIAVQHRERLDGSGYPRGLSGGAISRPARILGAADAYQAMREPRPHRPARSPDEAAAELRAEAKAGRLDAEAVEAVLGAAGHRIARRRDGPFGLTAREVDVLRLLARRALEQGDRAAARDHAEDRRQPRRAHLREDRRSGPARGRASSRCSTGSCRRRRFPAVAPVA